MYAAGSSRALRPPAQSVRRQYDAFRFAVASGAAYDEGMVHAGVGEDGGNLRRRAKVRLRWLVAAHAALATLPAASDYFPGWIGYYCDGALLSRALEGLLLAQVMLLAFWAGLGGGRLLWRLAGAALGCVYLAIWPAIGSSIPTSGGSLLRLFPGDGRHWADFPQTLFHSAGAIGLFVAVFAAAFFMVRRRLNELQWQPEADRRPRGGAIQYVLLSVVAVTVLVALFFIARHTANANRAANRGVILNGPISWEGASKLACVTFQVSTIYVVWAALGAGRICRRVVLSFVFAALTEIAIWFGGYLAWRGYALTYGIRIHWWNVLRWVSVSLLPVAILAATLLAVRACGYRLVRHAATRRQFTLRELLAALTLACAALAFVIVPAERQRRAVAALETARGSVEYGETGETLWEFWPACSLRDSLPRDYFDCVIKLSFDSQEATDALLVHLPALMDLEELSLWGYDITDAGLIHLRGLRRLRYLDLDGNPISDAGLAHLRGLAHLEELSLNGAEVTDAGLAHLKELPNLHFLWLSCPAVTDEGLAHLQGLTTLEGLGLENTRVTDAGLRRLEGLTGLRELLLYRTEVTEAGISRLHGALPNVDIYGP